MNNVYLIYGSNYGLIKKEIDNLSLGASDIVRYDLSETKIDDLLDDASCISLFGDKKVLIGDNFDLLTSSNCNINHNIDYLEKYIEDNHDNIVVLTVISEKLDERKKIVKYLKKNAKVIHKEEIDEKNLYKFVIREFKNKGYSIDFKTSNYFVNYVGNNVDIILSEIDKMCLYKDNNKIITIDDINSISSKTYNDNIFDLCDGIMKKDFKKIYDCYNDLKKLGEEEIKIISMISNQFILTYEVKTLSLNGYSSSQIKDILKVHPYRIKLALEYNYSVKEIKNIINKLHKLDYNIKSGTENKSTGLENFLLHM